MEQWIRTDYHCWHFILFPALAIILYGSWLVIAARQKKYFKHLRETVKNSGIGPVTAEVIVNGKPFHQAEKELQKAEHESVELIFFTDKKYPSRLRTIGDAPTLLYIKGNIDFETAKTVGIVGTRKSTDYGKNCIEELVKDLVPHGALIISGLAYGIDIQAHKQALKNSLPTIGIMGSGMDVIYPAMHRETATKMLAHGGLVTENCFGTKPDAHNFPARNRIIAGLSDALVVVEAAEKGGALITADIANSYNKDVFAFPGNIGQSFSEGCNNLIKSNRAHLISSIKDLEYIMNWSTSEKEVKRKEPLLLEQYEPDEQVVLKTLLEKNGQMMIDELSWASNLPVSLLASILLGLEFKGIIKPMPGKIYKVIKA